MDAVYIKALYEESPFLQRHLFYLAHSGSRSHGTATSTSDADLRGIAFSPLESMFGLESYEQTIIEEPDTVIYSLRKYFTLAMKGNPNILELLFVDPADLVVCNHFGEMIRRDRSLFLSQKVFSSFGGYAIKNIRKLSSKTEGSYDTKDASHLIRLLQTGKELLQHQHMEVKRPNAQELLAIKRGEWALTDVLRYAEQLFEEMSKAYEQTSLPTEPDYMSIQKLAIQMNQAFY